MIVVDAKRDAAWLKRILEGLRDDGCAVVEAVLDPAFIEKTRSAMRRTMAAISQEVGIERLQRAGELGVLRLMLKYDPHFFKFLELPEVLTVVDHTVSETAILHVQNGFMLPPFPPDSPSVFQTRFHMDFPRVLNGFLASVNVLFAIDDFKRDNGATRVVPGTHQRTVAPDPNECSSLAVSVECPAGSMLVFDSTLYHAAGPNQTNQDRFAINQQFTRSYFKQQIDYVRALGDDVVLAQKPRTQQLLGWYARVPTSLLEFYRPEEERLYRRGQG